MSNLSITLLIVTFLFAAAFSRVHAEDSPLVGTWINTNEDTRACPKFEISLTDEGTASFIWWGKTSPKDSRYGPFPMALSEDGKTGTAEHITKFSEMVFTVKMKGSRAAMEMATKYTDDSGRKAFELEEKFEKEK
ncbi:MAG: hypothetical protein P1U86_00670 [Verrucomicrobiales bacterium]|nr:hypothetical protein [Verrucomicrobiales bacterium]